MRYYEPHTTLKTHEVRNQPARPESLPLWLADPALSEATERWGGERAAHISRFAQRVSEPEVVEWGWRANLSKPRLITHDRYGHRVDEVDYHPDYHRLMKLGVESEVSSVAWQGVHDTGSGGQGVSASGHLTHAATLYLLSQVEPGVCCPLSMTYAAAPVLAATPALRGQFIKLTTPEYDPRSLPMPHKPGITMGMAMTEKQGGSDVRANLTEATPISGEEGAYHLTGHKWFCSAPMSDAFLTLARVDGAITCFFIPRWTPDERRNRFHLQRLKDKLGNHANASSEVEFDQAWALRVGEVGAGVKTIIEMVHHTRLDASLANASLMRRALTEALIHCTGRAAFGELLIKQPLMRAVLADLWLESEAATLTTLSLAHAFDEARYNPEARLFTRIATAVVKYWVCKRTPPHVYEALECHGGAGYVEESVMPRLYREAPLNSIWEGSGNVMCLDILRALQRSPASREAFLAEVERGRGHHAALDERLNKLRDLLGAASAWSPAQAASQARRLGAELALCLQGSLMARYAPETTSVAFCEARLREATPRVYGDLSPQVDVNAILTRATPLLDALAQ